MKLESYDKLHIDVSVVDQNSNAVIWRFTGFYGESRRDRRELLSFLNAQSEAPWRCAGDFNEILDAGEQFGGCYGRKGKWMVSVMLLQNVASSILVSLGYLIPRIIVNKAKII